MQQQNFDFISIPNANNISSSNIEDSNDPLYALSQNESSKTLKSDNNGKPLAYNLSTINFAALKGIVQNMPKNEQVNNIAVSSSGEIINITPLIDLESLLVQNQLQQKPVVKHTTPKVNKKTKCDKNDGNAEIKRQISDKYDKLPHIKSTQPG